MDDLVSIIVPVYNVAPYLDRCVSSLVGQTHPYIEILLVDDGSTDDSGALCDRWQERDCRIRVFHKPNGGLSDARNYGLERAAGEYVCFVDSDDWCDQRFVELMLRALLDTGSDLVECDYVPTEGAAPVSSQTDPDYQVFEGKDCFFRFLTNVFFVTVWNKLYRRSILENLPFRKGVYHEDEYWTYLVFSRAQRVCRLGYTGYCYFQRPGSIVHTAPSPKRLSDAFLAAKERIAFIEQHYPVHASIGYSKMMYTCMYLFNEASRGGDPRMPALQEELCSCFRIIFAKYLKRMQYQKEMWRFCFFRLLPKAYCRLSF